MIPIDQAELAKHNTAASCWVVIHGKVWDVTDFLNEHPGGVGLIMKFAGQDATDSYDEIHNADLVAEILPAQNYRGNLGHDFTATAQALDTNVQKTKTNSKSIYPPLSSLINISDFEKVAQLYLSPSAWAYYSSGSEDEISLQDSRRLFTRISLRPRILRNVETISTSTSILGITSSLPFYISPTGQGRYAHREAETILTRAAGIEGIVYCTPTRSSTPHEAVFGARVSRDQAVFFQLYANRDRGKTQELIRQAEALGAAAIFLTVDSPVLGRRERDERVIIEYLGEQEGQQSAADAVANAGVAKSSATGLLSSSLTWEDLHWIKETTSLPLVIKGIQSVEDAILAFDRGVQGIVLSNHGGRSLDTAQAPILTLLEISRHAPHLLAPEMRHRFQVFLDGGIRRGTDVLKALALGATAVGIGRPFLYALTAGYGEAGVRRLVQMLRTELKVSMALAGAVSVQGVVGDMVNSVRAEREVSRRVKL
ncbi:glycolate oxidase [Pseudomassariella vexata]|uniref:Glycolate oxidase n=1 Tax=Pseudomassariella vexata TaxID=1141098 RepID=A0A1Y2EFG7_9PEZI|nr:glycolate oxidase [Pseudomassariella vexata]ORY70328.1 glycolate oxidase [Pseudomassariella vexata]